MNIKHQNRVWKQLARNVVRIRVPKAFLPVLTMLFHHTSDAMAGDDRPDHGLARMRQGREDYRYPFYLLYGALNRAEKRMTPAQTRQAWKQFGQLKKAIAEDDRRFREKLEKSKPRAE